MANKKERMAKRAARIEKRKGLKEGEGADFIANRKQRVKELWSAPPSGQKGFTGKYQSRKGHGGAEEKKANTITSIKKGIGDMLRPVTTENFLSNVGPDRSNMSANAGSAFMRKKGY